MPPYFIQPQHPKATIAPEREQVQKLLKLGFWGQRKVNGHRAQIHLSSEGFAAFTRQGTAHTQKLPEAVSRLLQARFQPKVGWNVLDCEWQKQENKLYLFDLLKLDNKSLQTKNYEQRFALLTEFFFLDPVIEFLPVLKTLDACMKVLDDKNPATEGLVFKQAAVLGFSDSLIIRCRKNGVFFTPESFS